MPSPSDPTAFSLGGISIRWYALFILTGIIVAIWSGREIARRRGMDGDFILDIAPWVVITGVVGARTYYVLLKFDFYRDHPSEIINIRLGGMTIHGAIAGGVIAVSLLCLRKRERILAWADVIVPGLALAQAIGRWGNWANQEAFGKPSNLPWAVKISVEHRPEQYVDSRTFHPTFFYESIFDLVIGLCLAWVALRMPRFRRLNEGDVFWTYLVLYGTVRFFIERIRTDSLYIGPLPAAYWISFGLVGIGLGGLVLRHTIWPGRPADPVVTGEQAAPEAVKTGRNVGPMASRP